MFRHQLPRGPLAVSHLERPAIDRALAAKGVGAVVLFGVLAIAGVSLAGAAMFAAAALIVVARVPPAPVFAKVDWSLLVFFAGLFVVVAGLAHTGALARVFAWLSPVIARGDFVGELAFVAVIVIAANVVSNVPLVVVAVAWVPHLPVPAWGYVLLAVSSTLAGNLTMLGSVANIIVMEGAGEHGRIGFLAFLRRGAVITLVDLALALAILEAERALAEQASSAARILGV